MNLCETTEAAATTLQTTMYCETACSICFEPFVITIIFIFTITNSDNVTNRANLLSLYLVAPPPLILARSSSRLSVYI